MQAAIAPASPDSPAFLAALGAQVRLLRARRGMTRSMLADAAGVSLRYLAQLEAGQANASVLILRQLAAALGVAIEEMVSQNPPASSEFVLLADRLRRLPEAELRRARAALAAFLHPEASDAARARRIALIGLRGAGKSSLGRQLAARRGVPFIELNRAIEAAAGMAVAEIHSLYGQSGYRRYERECLETALQQHPAMVLSVPGSLVSEADTFNVLLAHCYTVWLKASPEEHMARVVAQGDLRPIAGHHQAMADLKRILEGRSPFYAQADATLDTSGEGEAASLEKLARLTHTPPLDMQYNARERPDSHERAARRSHG